MNVTPETVRAELEYRVEQALAGSALENVREARRVRRSWYRRLFEHDEHDEYEQVPNGPRRAG